MEQGIIYAHSCASDSLIIPRREIVRYMGCSEESPEVRNLILEFLPMVTEVLSFKGSFVYLPVSVSEDTIVLSDLHITSAHLAKNLGGCVGAVVFSLSCGNGIDRLVAKYSSAKPSAAFCINAIGTAAIESYADKFCADIAEIVQKDGLYTRPRFSPGYGDFSLEHQPFFIKLTNAGRLSGITLTDKLMMMPSKSVTAVMGISTTDAQCTPGGCEACGKKECKYRRCISRPDCAADKHFE